MSKAPQHRGRASARRLATTASRARPPAAGKRGPAAKLWPTHRPIPCARNAPLCPAAALERVATSVARYGLRQPIVVDDKGVTIAGHTRLAAAQRQSLARVPLHVADDLSPVNTHPLADIQTAQESAGDRALLCAKIGELAGLLHTAGGGPLPEALRHG